MLAATCDPSVFSTTFDQSTTTSTMTHRYKIFHVHVSRFGNISGAVKILNDPRTISEVLRAEILSNAGATEFGVECATFAWFIKGRYYYLILREDDTHFNIDLAMTQLSNLPGKPPADFFPLIQARMTRRSTDFQHVLKAKVLIPSSIGTELPHDGMDGTLFRDPDGSSPPIFAAPPLPHLNGGDHQTEKDLIDDWFKQIRDILTELKNRIGMIDVAFHGGGTIPIPDWFRNWCKQEGIIIFVND